MVVGAIADDRLPEQALLRDLLARPRSRESAVASTQRVERGHERGVGDVGLGGHEGHGLVRIVVLEDACHGLERAMVQRAQVVQLVEAVRGGPHADPARPFVACEEPVVGDGDLEHRAPAVDDAVVRFVTAPPRRAHDDGRVGRDMDHEQQRRYQQQHHAQDPEQPGLGAAVVGGGIASSPARPRHPLWKRAAAAGFVAEGCLTSSGARARRRWRPSPAAVLLDSPQLRLQARRVQLRKLVFAVVGQLDVKGAAHRLDGLPQALL